EEGQFKVVWTDLRISSGSSGPARSNLSSSQVKKDKAVLSPDASRVALVDSKSELCVYEATTGKVVFALPREKNTLVNDFSVVFSPDGKYLATNGDKNTIHVREAETGKVVRVLNSAGFLSATFSASASFSRNDKVATADGMGNLLVWDLATGKQFRIAAYRASVRRT